MLAPLDPAELDRAALARCGDVLPLLVDEHERVNSHLRALNWDGAHRSAFVRVDEDGVFNVAANGEQVQGRGFIALLATLAGVDRARAAVYLAELLARIGAVAA